MQDYNDSIDKEEAERLASGAGRRGRAKKHKPVPEWSPDAEMLAIVNKTIYHNSREKSGLNPGGQPGHIHHGRKRQEPTESHEIPAPDQCLEDPDFQPTGHIIRKQMIKVHVTTEVIEYWTAEFRNVITGQRVHAGCAAMTLPGSCWWMQ